MKLVLGFVIALISFSAIFAQPSGPVIKTSKSVVSIHDGDQYMHEAWKLDENLKPDVLSVNLVNGAPREVTFITDIDRISFQVESGKKYDFVIQKGETLYPQQIIGIAFRPHPMRFHTGNISDVAPQLHGPVLNLSGGGRYSKQALQEMVDRVRGCKDCDTKLDIVRIGTVPVGAVRDERHGLPNTIFFALNGVDSVTTHMIMSREIADLDQVVRDVEKAEIVFFDGGQQCGYVNKLKGTRLQVAVESVYKRGGGVGGTSAGEAILGDIVYDGCLGSVSSPDALMDPYNPSLTFTYDFFKFPQMTSVVTDQHFVKRDRMGRALAFLARQIQDARAKSVLAIAVDEDGALLIDPDGLAMVTSPSNAYLIVADHKPEVCRKGKPLTYSNFKVWRVKPGETYDLKNRPKTGYYTVSVKEGKLDRDPY